jgi:hypothetical protein
MLRPFSTAAGFDFLTAGISREDFRRAGDRSSDAKADITLTQVIMANESQVFHPSGTFVDRRCRDVMGKRALGVFDRAYMFCSCKK